MPFMGCSVLARLGAVPGRRISPDIVKILKLFRASSKVVITKSLSSDNIFQIGQKIWQVWVLPVTTEVFWKSLVQICDFDIDGQIHQCWSHTLFCDVWKIYILKNKKFGDIKKKVFGCNGEVPWVTCERAVTPKCDSSSPFSDHNFG